MTPSWWMPLEWAKALSPTMALLGLYHHAHTFANQVTGFEEEFGH